MCFKQDRGRKKNKPKPNRRKIMQAKSNKPVEKKIESKKIFS